jgi:hypothetical protein
VQRSKAKNSLGASSVAAALLIPCLWILTSPPILNVADEVAQTKRRLTSNKVLIKKFAAKIKSVPSGVNSLRTFAIAHKLPFYARDGFGQRFQYLRLSRDEYLMRSFGRDGRQNRMLKASDLSIGKWQPAKGLVYQYKDAFEYNIFPAVLLMGAESPTRLWNARLYIDSANMSRNLVIRHRKRKDFYMIAPHDGIEEFLWLPNGFQVVYTSTASARYKDGIYLWNLLTDEIVNLTEIAVKSQKISPTFKSEGLYLSLAGINIDGPTVSAYAMNKHTNSLDPHKFFDKKRFLSFVIPENGRPRLAKTTGDSAVTKSEPFTKKLHLDDHLTAKEFANDAQKEWLGLALHGNLEQVIMGWQIFSEKHAQSPLFPYCLWYLSSLYSESYLLLTKTNPRDSEILRSYGAEISFALRNYPLAPAYIRGLAEYTYENLLSGIPLPYRFAHLTMQQTQDTDFARIEEEKDQAIQKQRER